MQKSLSGLERELSALKEAISNENAVLGKKREELLKELRELRNLMRIEVKKGDKVRVFSLPLLMRQMFWELASATEERKRVLEVGTTLGKINEKLSSIVELVYSDLPQVVKQTKRVNNHFTLLAGAFFGLLISQIAVFLLLFLILRQF